MSEVVNQSKRYAWVDALKYLGIFAIYVGHMGEGAGNLHQFVFQYHVPLFFMISGFFAVRSLKRSFAENVKVKFVKIMIPYFGYCALNIIVNLLHTNRVDKEFLFNMIRQSIFGVRNDTVAGALWFLPCLFIIEILYDFIYRAAKPLKNQVLVGVFAGAGMFVLAVFFLTPPKWFWNFDSAVYYTVFYAAGAFIFPVIKDMSFSKFKLPHKIVFCVLFFSSLAATALIYLRVPDFIIGKIPFAFPAVVLEFTPLFRASIIIFVNIVFARFLSSIPLVCEIGKGTLVFCGTEKILKMVVESIAGIVGLTVIINTPLKTVLYTFLLLLLSHFTIVKFMNKYVKLLAGTYAVKKARAEPIPSATNKPDSI